MMKKLSLFLTAALLSVTMFAQSTWVSDPAHSKLTFSTVHMGIADVEGWFQTFEVRVTSSKADFSDAKFELNAEVNSINTGIEMRDNHLRSADFFEVEKYPKMTFKTKSIRKMWENRYKITGDLTIHGVTKEVTMDLWYRGTIENNGKSTAGFQLTGTIKRSDFNVGPDFPAQAISDKITIKADGEFIKQ